MALLVPQVLLLLVLETVVLGLLLVALPTAVRVHRGWDFPAATRLQLALERRTHLAATIAGFALAVELPALALHLAALDALSGRVAGAMCAVGVLSVTPNGVAALALRVLLLHLLVYWRALHRRDSARPEAPYARTKFTFLLAIIVVQALGVTAVATGFAGLATDRIATCCGTAFGPERTAEVGLAALPPAVIVALTGALFALLVVLWRLRRPVAFGIASAAFLAAGLFATTWVVSPYVYELPTHRCPFCLLRPEYGPYGWLLYGALFTGSVLGTTPMVLRWLTGRTAGEPPRLGGALAFFGVFAVLAVGRPLVYVWTRGTWL